MPLIVRNIQVRVLLAMAIQSWDSELAGLVPWDPSPGIMMIALRSPGPATESLNERGSAIHLDLHPACWAPGRGYWHGVIDNLHARRHASARP